MTFRVQNQKRHLQIKTVLFVPVKLNAFYLFSSVTFLTSLARSSHMVLGGSGDRGHVCLVSNLRGKTLSLSLLNNMLLAVRFFFFFNKMPFLQSKKFVFFFFVPASPSV